MPYGRGLAGRADLARRARGVSDPHTTNSSSQLTPGLALEPTQPRGMVFYSSTQRLVDAIAATLLSRDARPFWLRL